MGKRCQKAPDILIYCDPETGDKLDLMPAMVQGAKDLLAASQVPVTSPGSFSGLEGEVITVCLTAVDPTGAAIDWTTFDAKGSTLPDGSTPVPNSSGCFDYQTQPGESASGPYAFTFCVSNANGESNPSVVEIEVTSTPPVANDDGPETTTFDTPVVIDALANDAPGTFPLDPATVSEDTPPANGTLAIDPVTGEITYTPNPGFEGTDTFVYCVSDTNGTKVTATGTVIVEELTEVKINVVSSVDDSVIDLNAPESFPVFAADGTQLDDLAAVTAHVVGKYADATLDAATGRFCTEDQTAVDCPLTPACCTVSLDQFMRYKPEEVTGTGTIADPFVVPMESATGLALNGLYTGTVEVSTEDDRMYSNANLPSDPVDVAETASIQFNTFRKVAGSPDGSDMIINTSGIDQNFATGCGSSSAFLEILDLDTNSEVPPSRFERIEVLTGNVLSSGNLNETPAGTYSGTSSTGGDITIDALQTPISVIYDSVTQEGQFFAKLQFKYVADVPVTPNAAGDWVDELGNVYPATDVTCEPLGN